MSRFLGKSNKSAPQRSERSYNGGRAERSESRFGGSREEKTSGGYRNETRGYQNPPHKKRTNTSEEGDLVNIGNFSAAGKPSEDTIEDLRNTKQSFWWTVYLPKGVEELTLKNKDKVLISVGQFSEKAPKFVVGSVSLKTNGNK